MGHLAGYKIRAFREARGLSAAEFGQQFGRPAPWPARTVYGWETLGKIPTDRKVASYLAEVGVCDPADWLQEPAEPTPQSAAT